MHETVYVGWKDREGAHVYRIEGGRADSLDILRRAFGREDVPFGWYGEVEGVFQVALVLSADMIVDTLSAVKVSHRLAGRLNAHIRSCEWCFTESKLREWLSNCWKEQGFSEKGLAWITDHLEHKGGA